MTLHVTLAQTDPVWENPALNLAEASRIVRRSEADLVVFPEMFTTGFVGDPSRVAETTRGAALAWFVDTAAGTGKALCGSIAVVDGGRYYNRLVFARPGMPPVFYDKRHLFGYGGETRYFTAGTRRPTVEWGGMRILPLICYDLRFPVWSRCRGDYDVLLYVASWPASRGGVWDTLLRARAIENQCYVLGVNRVGTDPAAQYDGRSVALDFYGQPLAAADRTGLVGTVDVRLERAPLDRFRAKFPALADADRFTIEE